MIVNREFHNVECDCCGQLLDEETWRDDKDVLPAILAECGWSKFDDDCNEIKEG